MKKDTEWLKEELLKDLMRFSGNSNMTDYELGIASGIRTAINLTEKLDEPEVEENFYTFDNARKWLQENGFVVFEKDKLDAEVQRMIDETYKKMSEKPVIPQFVAEVIETYKKRGDSLGELLGHIEWSKKSDDKTLLKVVDWVYPDNYSGVDTDGINTIARAWLDGYEVEKEILWEIPMPDLKTSDGHIQYLTYDPEAKTYFVGRKNGRLKQTFNAKDFASVPGQYRRYAELCDFKKIEEVTE